MSGSTLIDAELRRDIQLSESCVLTAYKDTKGFWTVAWGHKLPVGHDWAGYSVTQDAADEMLVQDILDAQALTQTLIERVVCNRVRANALTELVFNMGLSTWKKFIHCRAAWQAQAWKTAAAELMNSDWYNQVHATRGDRLCGYLLTGSYPPSAGGASSSPSLHSTSLPASAGTEK